MAYTIPEGSVEAQVGLWAHLHTFTHNGNSYAFYHIYSAEGYCFWEVAQPENYYEDGTLKPPSERVYARYCSTCCTTIDQVNAAFISVPIEEGYEIVTVGDSVS